MTYLPDTILERKEPKGNDPYDKVRVIGVSPTSFTAAEDTHWGAGGGQGILLQPVEEFGANADVPLGEVQDTYKIVFEPDISALVPTVDGLPAGPLRPILNTPPSPEDRFRADQDKPAKKAPAKKAD